MLKDVCESYGLVAQLRQISQYSIHNSRDAGCMCVSEPRPVGRLLESTAKLVSCLGQLRSSGGISGCSFLWLTASAKAF